MKLRRSYKHYYKRLKVRHYRLRSYRYGKGLGPRHYTTLVFAWMVVCGALIPAAYMGKVAALERTGTTRPPIGLPGFSEMVSMIDINLVLKGKAGIIKAFTAVGIVDEKGETITPPPSNTFKTVTTTVFWVGEPAGPENDNIQNSDSAWDDQWKEHFGGLDDPANRNGYLPAAFTPKENPFYFALPYNDLDENGNRKSTASLCPDSASKASLNYSWCKNSWIMIRANGKVAYAQWEDVGPNEEDDPQYVFGNAKPKNTFDARAGLDVSPAVRDFLGLGDVDSAEWTFVSAGSVPSGSWKNIITTSLGYSVN